MWIARDKDGRLSLFRKYPERDKEIGMWLSRYDFMYIDKTLFPDLKWEDDPIEVEIIIKRDSIKNYVDSKR